MDDPRSRRSRRTHVAGWMAALGLPNGIMAFLPCLPAIFYCKSASYLLPKLMVFCTENLQEAKSILKDSQISQSGNTVSM
jgi:hypothetical protein